MLYSNWSWDMWSENVMSTLASKLPHSSPSVDPRSPTPGIKSTRPPQILDELAVPNIPPCRKIRPWPQLPWTTWARNTDFEHPIDKRHHSGLRTPTAIHNDRSRRRRRSPCFTTTDVSLRIPWSAPPKKRLWFGFCFGAVLLMFCDSNMIFKLLQTVSLNLSLWLLRIPKSREFQEARCQAI